MSQIDLLKLNFSKMEELLIYRQILNDRIFKKIFSLVISLDRSTSNQYYNEYYQICYELLSIAEQEGFQGDLLKNYLTKIIATDKNTFTLASEKSGCNISPSLYQVAIHDLKILKEIFKFSLTDIGLAIGVEELRFISHYSRYKNDNNKDNGNRTSLQNNFKQLKESLVNDQVDKIVENFVSYYNKSGCGDLAKYSSFRWDKKGLVGIDDISIIKFDDIIGYNQQKETLIENTLIFLEGNKANNVLLYGDSGTGKSSSVKALVNKFSGKGLRLVEINKEQIKAIPQIIDILKRRGLFFIIFMDDLSFEDFETDYKYLKAVMEGGIEGKPDNIIFYATTNRKHIIKEKWQDRNDNEVHKSDAQQEKLSLSERFGITITYLSPDQREYLEIVKGLAVDSNILLSEDELIDQALKWEKWHHGRSGRTARQFINYLAGKGSS